MASTKKALDAARVWLDQLATDALEVVTADEASDE
jgi:hypothetical protein